MVENKSRKIEKDEIILCRECNNAIPKEILEKSVGGIKNLYCQYCGVSLNLFPDPIDNIVSGESPFISHNTQKELNLTKIKQITQESDLALSYSNIRNALRNYIYQLIYQLLTSTPITLKKIENKKELKSSHINIILKKLWNELKDLNRSDLANQELVSSRRRIRNYFEEFQSSLRPYKKFRKVNFALFAENIEFVFGLILGDYEFSNLTTSKKRIVFDLKKNFGFKSDTATTNSFTYNISLIVSKKIRNKLSQYHITEGNDNRLALDEIFGHVIDYIVTNKDKLSDLSEFNNSKKKKFHKTLEILIANLKTDWIYRISFEDHIYKLIIIVNSLMCDANYSSNLIGFERLISQGLTQSALFEKDQDFSPHFKLNLTLILCRIIYLKIKNSPNITKLDSKPVNLSITNEFEVRNSILDEITAGKKINSQILKKFYKLLLEEFQTHFEKLQQKLNSDLVYLESFRVYISDLVRLVFNIVHSISKKSHLTQLELAVVKDLANYNFEWFNKKPDRSYFYYLNLSNQSSEDTSKVYNQDPDIDNLLGEFRIKINSLILRKIYDKFQEKGITIKKVDQQTNIHSSNVFQRENTISENSFSKLTSFMKKKLGQNSIFELFGQQEIPHEVYIGAHQEVSIRKDGNSAELVAILLGDGHLSKNKKLVSITLNNVDEELYVVYVRKLLSRFFPNCFFVSPKPNSKAVSIQSTTKYVHYALIKLGLIAGNKVENQVGCPLWLFQDEKTIIGTLKGLFDTDGSIVLDKTYNHLILRFTSGSKPLAEGFKQLCDVLKIETGKIIDSNSKPDPRTGKISRIFRVQIASLNHINKFFNKIKPEKLLDPYRRMYIGTSMIFETILPSQILSNSIYKRIDQEYPNKIDHMFSKKFALYLKSLTEKALIKIKFRTVVGIPFSGKITKNMIDKALILSYTKREIIISKDKSKIHQIRNNLKLEICKIISEVIIDTKIELNEFELLKILENVLFKINHPELLLKLENPFSRNILRDYLTNLINYIQELKKNTKNSTKIPIYKINKKYGIADREGYVIYRFLNKTFPLVF